jgi:hypothetical protein
LDFSTSEKCQNAFGRPLFRIKKWAWQCFYDDYLLTSGVKCNYLSAANSLLTFNHPETIFFGLTVPGNRWGESYSFPSEQILIRFGFFSEHASFFWKRPRGWVVSAFSGGFSQEDSSAKVELWEAPTEFSTAIIRDCLRCFPEVRLRIKGSCMSPCIVSGMTVILGQKVLHPPRIGDVVLLHHPAGLRLHRLFWGPPLASGSSRWRTRAERAFASDPWITPEKVLGTVVGVEELPGQDTAFRGWALIRFMIRSLLKELRSRFMEKRLF